MLLTMAHVAMAGPHGLPAPFAAIVSGISFIAGLAPYAIADKLLDLWRHHRDKSTR
jgi:hypothetical protein